MDELMCPRCGSRELNQLGPAEYNCSICGTGFMLTSVDTGFVDVVLTQVGKDPFRVMLALREISYTEADVQAMDIVAVRRLIDTVPCVIATNVTGDVANRIRKSLENSGAIVELKPA